MLSQHMSQILSVKQWVYDRAMDFCDRATLQSCAQACRAWAPHARFLLFEDTTVHLKLDGESNGFDPALDQFRSFILELNVSKPNSGSQQQNFIVADLVSKLHISGTYIKGSVVLAGVKLTVLETLIVALPNLKILKLSGIKIKVDTNAYPPSAPGVVLQSLSLNDVTAFHSRSFSSELAVHVMLSLYTSVRTLCIGTTCNRTMQNIAKDVPIPPGSRASAFLPKTTAVETLDLYSVLLMPYLSLVAVTQSHSSLRHLTLNLNTSTDIAAFEIFLGLGVANTCLTNMEIEVTACPNIGPVCMDLRSYTNLKSFTLKCNACCIMDDIERAIILFLEHLPPSLETYTLDLAFGLNILSDFLQEFDQSCMFTWFCLDLFLSDFESIQEVNFLVSVDFTVASTSYGRNAAVLELRDKESPLDRVGRQILTIMEAKLPRVLERGILNPVITFAMASPQVDHDPDEQEDASFDEDSAMSE